MIQLFSNSLGGDELKAVEAVFQSRWLGKGKECSAFEHEFAAHLNTSSALLTNSCTSAIQIAVRALGIGDGDEVIVSTVNFVACATAVLEAGANPVFADVDPSTLNLVQTEIERLKTPRTKAVFLLHYGGHPAEMDEIRAACGPRIAIIEDSANAISSSYKDRMCGAIGDAGVFSFDAMKTLVMSDGGTLILQDHEVLERARTLRYMGLSSGRTSGMEAMASEHRWWEYDLDALSGRSISNDLLAAIGRVQLKRLPGFLRRRKEVWERYQAELSSIGGLRVPPEPAKQTTSSYYLYWVQVEDGREDLASYLADNGVYSSFRYFPLHLVKYLQTNTRLSAAEYVNERTLNLPLHQNLSDDDVSKVIDLLRRYFSRRSRPAPVAAGTQHG